MTGILDRVKEKRRRGDIPFEDSTYSRREKAVQSRVHEEERKRGMGFFRSVGYKIYPDAFDS